MGPPAPRAKAKSAPGAYGKGPKLVVLSPNAKSFLAAPANRNQVDPKMAKEFQKFGLANGGDIAAHLPKVAQTLKAGIPSQTPGLQQLLQDPFGHQHGTKLANYSRAAKTAVALDKALSTLQANGQKLSWSQKNQLATLAKQGHLDKLMDPKLALTPAKSQAVLVHLLQRPQDAEKLNQILGQHTASQAGKTVLQPAGEKALKALLRGSGAPSPNVADTLMQLGFNSPDKLLKDPTVTKMLGKLGLKNVDGMAGALAKSKDGLEFMIELAKAARARKKGSHFAASGHLLRAMGSLQGFAHGTPLGNRLDQKTAQLLGKTMKLLGGKSRFYNPKATAQFLRLAAKAGVMSGVTKMVGHILKGDTRDLAKEIADFAKGIAWSTKLKPHEKAAAGANLLQVVGGFMPAKTVQKMLAKAGARKVPVLSLLLGAYDLSKTAYHGTGCLLGSQKSCGQAQKSGLDAVSSVSGAFPGVGTAVSTGVDVYRLVHTLATHRKQVLKTLKAPGKLLDQLTKP